MPEATPPVLRHSSLTGGPERRGISGGRSTLEHQQQVSVDSEVQTLELESTLEDAEVLLLGGKSTSLKGAGSYRILYICVSAAAFVNAMTFSVLGPFLPEHVSTRFGSTSSQVGLIMATYPAVNLVTSPLVGSLMNRYGRLNVLFSGLVTLTVATLLYGMARSVFWLFVASGLHGASLSLIHVSSLALLSAFPERITEGMGGIEVWSGVALVIGPPLGGLAHPLGGVSSMFVLMAMFPLAMLAFVPRIQHLMRSAKDGFGDVGPSTTVSIWNVAWNRGVLAGAFATIYNNGMIGFFEATLSPHLARTLATSPSSIGFVFILPNVLYTVMAAKAERVVDRIGLRKTLLCGLAVMSGSLMLFGPSPALAPVILTRGAAKGSIGFGLLAFQVGSALAAVPAFTVMQAGVASMGNGGNNAVASVHSLSIGLGEVVGPVLGGMMLELLPRSPAMACEPVVVALESVVPIKVPEAGLAAPAATAGIKKTADRAGAGTGDKNLSFAISTGGKAYTKSGNDENLLVDAHKGATRVLLDGDGHVSRARSPRGEEEEEGLAAVGSEDEARKGYNGWQMGSVDGGLVRIGTILSVEWDADDNPAGKATGKEDKSIHIGESDANPRGDKAGRPRIGDSNELPKAGAPAVGVAYEGGTVKRAVTSEWEKGGSKEEGRDGDGAALGEAVPSCDTSFPLATTLLAWASAFGIAAMYRLYPQVKDNGMMTRSSESSTVAV